MQPARGKVPQFKLRPNPVAMTALVFVLIIGSLITLSILSKEEGTGVYRQKAFLSISITAIICFCLGILATSKMWFSHLWKKNSTHSRHRDHSHHHPAVKKQIHKQKSTR